METILKVTGMNCGACVGHVSKALEETAGVQSAQVDLASGTATVQHAEDTDLASLVEAVIEEGFEAKAT